MDVAAAKLKITGGKFISEEEFANKLDLARQESRVETLFEVAARKLLSHEEVDTQGAAYRKFREMCVEELHRLNSEEKPKYFDVAKTFAKTQDFFNVKMTGKFNNELAKLRAKAVEKDEGSS